MSDPIPALPGTELRTWHLAGLTSDARVRDDTGYDVLARTAAKLQQVDARLGEVGPQLR